MSINTNCKVATKKQLFQEISLLIDEHINYALHKKPEFDFVIQTDNTIHIDSKIHEEAKKKIKTKKQKQKNDNEICIAVLTNGKQCSRQKFPTGKKHGQKPGIGQIPRRTIPLARSRQPQKNNGYWNQTAQRFNHHKEKRFSPR